MDGLFQDLGFGVRSLRRRPALALIAICTLALGIGGNTAIFSALYAVVLQPLPFTSPDQLAMVHASEESHSAPLSGPEYHFLREQGQFFDHLAAFYRTSRNLTSNAEPVSLAVAEVTPNMLQTLGVQPSLGRGFLSQEGQVGQHRVVLLSEGLWRSRFGGDDEVLGTFIRLDEVPHEVVGIIPDAARLALRHGELWVPLVFQGDHLTSTRTHVLSVIARVRAEMSVENGIVEAKSLLERFQQPLETEHRDHSTGMTTLHEVSVGSVRPRLILLMVSVAAVLLIACTNIANLLLVRSEQRRKELALRAALGAGQGRLFRQIMGETLAISLFGGLLGLLVSSWAVGLLIAFSPQGVPRLDLASPVGPLSILFTFILALVTGVAIGLIPAFHASRVDIQESIKAESGGSTRDRRRDLSRSSLVVAQVGLSLLLLIGAGLLLRSFWGLLQVDPGFEAKGAYTTRLDMSDSNYPDLALELAFADQLLSRLESIPWVEAAAVVNPLPMSGGFMTLGVKLDPADDPDQGEHRAVWRSVSPGFFESLKVPLLRGRLISPSDNQAGAVPVVVINESMAGDLWPGGDALGKRIRIGYDDIWCEVVGVVKDVRHNGLGSDSGNEIHTAIAVTPWKGWGGMDLVVRASSSSTLDRRAMSEEVRRQVWELDALLPVDPLTPIGELVSASVAPQRFLAALVGGFALMALVMAALGIYGVLSFSVARRTREIGVRLALGAHPKQLLKLILRQGMSLVGIGVVVGLAAAWALSKLLSSQLYEVSASDPLTYGAVAVIVAVVAFIANYLPARRAATVDPLVALRHD
ncbi:MAG: ABC transporter permease [Deltaproteobacteria bacterium]|nr:ABC transporter permease [Deltaproteobacteria bacterium]